jgi:hypothetical protein
MKKEKNAGDSYSQSHHADEADNTQSNKKSIDILEEYERFFMKWKHVHVRDLENMSVRFSRSKRLIADW